MMKKFNIEHIGLTVKEPVKMAKWYKGAKFIEKCPVTMPGDYLIVLNDPWDNCIQLVKRNKKIKK